MNAKKIFKTILGVGTLVGTAYVAYRTGYLNGKDTKLSESDDFNDTGNEDDASDFDDDEDSDFINDDEEIFCKPEPEVSEISEKTSDFDNFSNENQEFINSTEEISCEPEISDAPEETNRFKHFSEIDIGNIFVGELIYALQIISRKSYIFNKTLRDYMGITKEKADKILTILENAGYISEKDRHSGRKVYINWEDYKKLYG